MPVSVRVMAPVDGELIAESTVPAVRSVLVYVVYLVIYDSG